MGAEESRTKGASLGSSIEAVDQSLEVKEEDTAANYVAKKLTEVENEADIQSEKLKSLETSFAKLRVENCNLKYQLSFVSEKVVRLEKHDVHFINALKDTITLELLEKIRLLEDRLKKLESPEHVVVNHMHKNSGREINSPEANDINEDLQDFLVYDEDNLCNLSEVTVDEADILVETHEKVENVTMPVNDNAPLEFLSTDCKTVGSDLIVVAEAGDMFTATDEELVKGLLKRSVDVSHCADLTVPSSKHKEPSGVDIKTSDKEPNGVDIKTSDKEPSGVDIKTSDKILSDVDQLAKFRVEEELVILDKEITSSLSSSNQQLSKCSELLDKLLGLELTPVMLLKQPSVVQTVEDLRHYDQGNNSMVKLINSRSESCHLKFLELFPSYTNEKSEFLIFFQEQVQRFTDSMGVRGGLGVSQIK